MELYKDGISKQYRELKSEYNLNFKDQGKCIEALKRDGWVEVLPSPKPTCKVFESARRDGVELDAKGNTVEKYIVVDMFNDYTNEDDVIVTKAEQEAKHLAKLVEQAKDSMEQAIQAHINTTVTSKGYDNENSIAKYLVDTNPFYDECKAISLWIGSVWVKAFNIQQEVEAGTRVMPTVDELIAMLPIFGA